MCMTSKGCTKEFTVVSWTNEEHSGITHVLGSCAHPSWGVNKTIRTHQSATTFAYHPTVLSTNWTPPITIYASVIVHSRYDDVIALDDWSSIHSAQWQSYFTFSVDFWGMEIVYHFRYHAFLYLFIYWFIETEAPLIASNHSIFTSYNATMDFYKYSSKYIKSITGVWWWKMNVEHRMSEI